MAPLSVRLSAARFLDPALLLLIALAVGLWLAHRGRPLRAASRRERTGRIVTWCAWALLWAFTTPFVAGLLVDAVETREPDLSAALAGKDPARTALVVLAGGLRTYDHDVPPRERLDASSQSRIIGAARLFHAHGFGLVILSGSPGAQTEAMADLITALGVPRERLAEESQSFNTRENAIYSVRILRAHGIEDVVVTTSATHLRRAVQEFERAGVHPIPAAVDIIGRSALTVDALFPAAPALARSHQALHEVLGMLKP